MELDDLEFVKSLIKSGEFLFLLENQIKKGIVVILDISDILITTNFKAFRFTL